MLTKWLRAFFFLTLGLAALPTAFAQTPAEPAAAAETSKSQSVLREPPTWWFGVAGGANLNFYWGTTQQLNSGTQTPAAFHKGFGAGLYFAPVLEYRPNPVWGGILQIGYDDRRGSFYDVPCPCGENSTLSAKPSYLSIEPSLRLAPFAGDFYLFAGPRLGYRWSATGDDDRFEFTREGFGSTEGTFSGMKSMVFSGQFGMGYEVALASKNARTQVNLAPFASYQPHFGQDPRKPENWGISTLRVGAALKFGRGKAITDNREVRFSVNAPAKGASKRRVRETFPLRNYVYFEDSSTRISDRYVTLKKSEADDFREEQLQEAPPKSLKGRSQRQMGVYYNILNTVGDRMKRNPETRILLSGSSVRGPEHGKERAEEVKRYLVGTFGIDAARIATEGRENPRALIQPDASPDATLLTAGNQRVEITSNSPEMLLQVGSPQDDLKPVNIVGPVEEPQDSVIFSALGADRAFSSWMLEITDDQGKLRRFGPFTGNRAAVHADKILGNRAEGHYKVVMVGQSLDGTVVRKESAMDLARRYEGIQEVTRFTILFDFGQTKTVATYERFLTEVVVPLVGDSSLVVIRGQTDAVGDIEYNENLSRERAQGAQAILESALTRSGRRGVTYDTRWYGEDSEQAPFDNDLPEQRAYNRTVIIDIVPHK